MPKLTEGTVIEFTCLNIIMNDDFRERVVKRAFEFRGHASSKARQQLDHILRTKVQVPGARPGKWMAAPKGIVTRQLVNGFKKDNEGIAAILRVWVESQAELKDALQHFIAENQVPSIQEIDYSFGFPGIWLETEMGKYSEAFHYGNPDIDPDDIALMLCCLTGQALVPEDFDIGESPGELCQDGESNEQAEREMEEQNPSPSSLDPVLIGWLAELDGLGEESLVWSELDAFFEAAGALRQSKQIQWEAERREKARQDDLQTKRTALEQALLSLEENKPEYEYLEMLAVTGWNAPACPDQQVETATSQIILLKTILQEHSTARLSPSATRKDEQLRYDKLKDLGDKALLAYNSLVTIFASGTSPTGATAEPTPISGGLGAAPSELESQPPEDTESEATEQEEGETSETGPEEDIVTIEDENKTGIKPLEEQASTTDAQPEQAQTRVEVEHPQMAEADTSKETTASGGVEKPEPAVEEVYGEQEIERPVQISARTIPEIAGLIKVEENLDNWQALGWALAAENDIAGAYWLSRSLEMTGQDSPLPTWMLSVLQGSQWLEAGSDALVNDIFNLVVNQQVPQDPVLQLLGFAASIVPVLVAPNAGLIDFLDPPKSYPVLYEMAGIIRDFAGLGIELRGEDVQGVSGEEARAKSVQEAARAAKRWLEGASSKHTKYIRATEVWRYLVGPKGEIRKILSIAAENRTSATDEIQSLIEKWESQEFIIDKIEEIDALLYDIKTHRIEGAPRDQVIRYVDEACRIARNWLRLVLYNRKIEIHGNWYFGQVAAFRQKIQRVLPDVYEICEALCSVEQTLSHYAAGRAIKGSLSHLTRILAIENIEGIETPDTDLTWSWLNASAVSLEDAINRRLFLLPEMHLDDSGYPDSEDIPGLRSHLLESLLENRSIPSVVERWLDIQDYRFVDKLLCGIPDQESLLELKRRCQESLSGSRLALIEKRNATGFAIEQAYGDGIIIDEKRSELMARVETVNPEQTLNVAVKYKVLDDIADQIKSLRIDHIHHLQDAWEKLQVRLDTYPIDTEKRQQVNDQINNAFEQADRRILEEYLARVSEILDSKGDFNESWAFEEMNRDVLSEFINLAPEIERWLGVTHNLARIIEDVKEGSTHAGIPFGELPAKRRDEAVEALHAWRRLKQQGADGENNDRLIAMLMNYLGFTNLTGIRKAVSIDDVGKDWCYARVEMTAGGFARPIPQFGSLSKDVYHVVCLWERPVMDAIAVRLTEIGLKQESAIVFYLGRITPRQRADLIRVSKDNNKISLVVLDEVLLLFLAQERETRLPAFLRCTLPFTTLNPYTPFQAGDVPPEIFYGRGDDLLELERQQGSCLIYGGRQLGKSALLRHVERDFNFKERGQFAKVEDIKLVGDPSSGLSTDIIWKKLRDSFRYFELLSSRIQTDNIEELERYILEVFEKNPDIRILILFDEADHFLDADAKDNFRITETLRTLMVNTERRFKVVFAGLHNVQRFQGIPNQPLAHFGKPIPIGPLDPDAARKLICQPLDFLGYRFRDDSGPLRILSYTNYHPGLIQLFCQEILNRLQKRNPNRIAPFFIEQSDIEAAHGQVRDAIRERFDWTLALDPRYQAVAWSMVVDQMSVHDSFARAYSPGEILKQVTGWWPQGFKETDIAELRGRLEEMVGLGVLVRDPLGLYRLRSPNLVRLMGAEADIETQLLELENKQPEVSFEADAHHAPIDDEAQYYSPFTYAQARSINAARFGACMLFASEALGSSSLPKAFKIFVPNPIEGSCTDIPIYITSGEDLNTWLDRHLRVYDNQERIIVYQHVPRLKVEELCGFVEGVLEFTTRRQSKKKTLRIIFIIEPHNTWSWLSLPQDVREGIENRLDAAHSMKRWTLSGIRQRLAQHDMMHSEKICKEILASTGGWPGLLNRLFERCGKSDNPHDYLLALDNEINQPGSQLQNWFLQACGIQLNGAVQQVVQFLLPHDRLPMDYIVPDMFGHDASPTPEDCKRAIEYLQYMDLVTIQDGEVTLDSIVKKIYPKP